MSSAARRGRGEQLRDIGARSGPPSPAIAVSVLAIVCWASAAPAVVSAAPPPSARRPTADAAAPLPSPRPTAAMADEEIELLGVAAADRVRRWLNLERRERGLEPLVGDPTLDGLARSHSLEMARRGGVTHYSDEYGLTTERRVKLAFPGVVRLGENVARNRTLEALHEALMASRGHRRNRLDPDFTHVGLGLARRGPYRIFLTEIFVAAPRGRSLGPPVVVYSERPPGSFVREESPRAEVRREEITVRSPEVGDPDDPEGLTHRGIREFHDGEYRAAAATFRAALELDPDYWFARFNLARALARSGAAGEARDELTRLLRDRPDDLDARFTYGVAALLEGDYPAAEAAFRRVLHGRRDDAGSWYNLGLALEYQDRLAEASAAYAQALHVDPDHRAARLGLARSEGS